jgi:hypothetical protein
VAKGSGAEHKDADRGCALLGAWLVRCTGQEFIREPDHVFFFSRWFTPIIYYIKTNYSIVHSVKEGIQDATHRMVSMNWCI